MNCTPPAAVALHRVQPSSWNCCGSESRRLATRQGAKHDGTSEPSGKQKHHQTMIALRRRRVMLPVIMEMQIILVMMMMMIMMIMSR